MLLPKIISYLLIRRNILIFIAFLFLFLHTRCSNDAKQEENNLPEGDILLDVLFADAKEFKYIHPGYSEGAESAAPWGFEHKGLDLITSINGAQVIAPAIGVVDEISIYCNPRNNQWQVNMRILYNHEFKYHILFEPRAPSENEIIKQRNAISVSVGQNVKQGELLGKILDLSYGDLSGGEPGIHFDLWKFEEIVCPGNYMTPDAIDRTLELLWAMYPQAKICYP